MTIYTCNCAAPPTILDHAYDCWRYIEHGIPERYARVWRCGECGKEYESA